MIPYHHAKPKTNSLKPLQPISKTIPAYNKFHTTYTRQYL